MAVLFEISCQRSFQLILIFFLYSYIKQYMVYYILLLLLQLVLLLLSILLDLRGAGKSTNLLILWMTTSRSADSTIYLLAHLVCQTESNHLLLILSITCCCCCFYFILNFLTILIIVDNQYGYHYFIYINIVAILNTI